MAVKEKENNIGLMPQNIEAEEAVLGAILVNPNVITKVVETIKPESFYKPAHRYIYEAMIQLFNSNERIDIVSVSDVLNYNSKLETIGGRAFVNDLCYKTITTSNVEYYAKIVQEKAIKRALINAGSEIVSFGYDVNPIDQSLDSAEKLIFDIASKKATSDLTHVKDLVLNKYHLLVQDNDYDISFYTSIENADYSNSMSSDEIKALIKELKRWKSLFFML